MQRMFGFLYRVFCSGLKPGLNAAVRPALQNNIFTIAGNHSENDRFARRQIETLRRYRSRCCMVTPVAGLAWLSPSLRPASARERSARSPLKTHAPSIGSQFLPVAHDPSGPATLTATDSVSLWLETSSPNAQFIF
jgi:hypothetical protein